ncbi:MAG: YiiD C-terminal domain-containing protein [Planctomycetota bacterium]
MNPPLTAIDSRAAAICDSVQAVLRAEIPLSEAMAMTVDRLSAEGLWLSMPLAPNRNPHQTAFAGSLNALCTLAGWAMTDVLLKELSLAGATVIRRSSIKYHQPVESDRVSARCLPPRQADWEHFAEMLAEKGQAKLDHVVEIAGTEPDRPAVLFGGSYVVSVGRDQPPF